MRLKIFGRTLILTLVFMSPLAGFSADFEGPYSIESGSKREAAQVFLPNGYRQRSEWPVILLLHGYAGWGELMDYYFGMSAQVSKRGFILVVPNGNKDGDERRYWNATPGCCDFAHSQVDDVGYLTSLLETVESTYHHVDRSRIYVVGHSNGGFMAHRLACEKGDLIAGIVSLAGVPFKDPSDCKGTMPVSVLQIHALEDDTIKYAGDPGYPKLAPYPGAEETVRQWVAHDQCAPEAETGTRLALTVSLNGSADTTTRYWRNCAGNTTVALWTIDEKVPSPHTPPLRDEFTVKVLDFLFEQRK